MKWEDYILLRDKLEKYNYMMYPNTIYPHTIKIVIIFEI